MKLTGYGKREWLSATIVAVLLLLLLFSAAIFFSFKAAYLLVLLVIVVWIAFAGFFRDPERIVPQEDDLLISPADGVVKDIELIPASECQMLEPVFQGKDMLRIGIFLSVFDVHINRAPCPVTIQLSEHKDGKYYDARDVRAGKENESQVIAGTATAAGREFPIAVRQVSGAIARRIVCPVAPGRKLVRGEKYGMIKFGSRTELYLPARSSIEVCVRVGDRVQGGLTVLAVVNKNPTVGN